MPWGASSSTCRGIIILRRAATAGPHGSWPSCSGACSTRPSRLTLPPQRRRDPKNDASAQTDRLERAQTPEPGLLDPADRGHVGLVAIDEHAARAQHPELLELGR